PVCMLLRAAACRKEVVREGFPPQAPHQERMLLVLDSGRMLEGDGFIQRFDHSGVLHTLRLLSKTRSQKKSTRYDASAPPLLPRIGTSTHPAPRSEEHTSAHQ